MQSDKRTIQGVVVSNLMEKTVVVQVKKQFSHPLYKKVVTKHKKFYAHDEENKCKKGDIVILEESRPLSKKKRWTVKEILPKVGGKA